MNSFQFLPAYPEIFLAIAISAILLIDVYSKDAQRGLTYRLSLYSCLIVAALNLAYLDTGETWYIFGHMFVSDPLSNLLKVASSIAVAVTLVYSRNYVNERGMVTGERHGEFYVLALFSLLGQMVMISANNFMTIFLGLELLSLALYAMVALRRDSSAAMEAAMKYFILGALSSGFLLYGMSMVYGATGSLDLSQIARVLTAGSSDRTVLVFGLVFIISGLAFKLGVVPYHMWVPDVYQGAPTAVTLLIGGAPKLAAFAITLRLLVEGMITLAVDWQQMLLVLALLSLVVGNLSAIAQTSIKRMLAYSTIAHMGFMLLGMMSGIINGNAYSAAGAYSAALFYTLTYVLTTLGSFGVLLAISRHGSEADRFEDFKGLHKRAPGLALIMMIMMFSLAGVPPTVGFYAKFAVLGAVVGTGMIWLAVFAVMTSLIAAFYYLRVVKMMYFDAPEENSDLSMTGLRGDMKTLLIINGAAVLVLGLMPEWLMRACISAMTRTLTS
jgi:NADH-quinone oxidoreductase subunit N